MCGSCVEKYVIILIVKKYLTCNNNRSVNSSFVFCHSENFGIGGKWRGLKSSLRNMSPIKSGPHDVELSQWVPLLTLLERLVVYHGPPRDMAWFLKFLQFWLLLMLLLELHSEEAGCDDPPCIGRHWT
ncbi:hypothetical protein TIFTF001_039390 [Ficus carica]|uniref:Uncharacterized protein n=1 Tax=Ficus carica TaxID=3494 RepID=A0AA88EC97_FICCA|nr:hypothetical protein TIFTF001_039390 [Ficus carica]